MEPGIQFFTGRAQKNNAGHDRGCLQQMIIKKMCDKN